MQRPLGALVDGGLRHCRADLAHPCRGHPPVDELAAHPRREGQPVHTRVCPRGSAFRRPTPVQRPSYVPPKGEAGHFDAGGERVEDTWHRIPSGADHAARRECSCGGRNAEGPVPTTPTTPAPSIERTNREWTGTGSSGSRSAAPRPDLSGGLDLSQALRKDPRERGDSSTDKPRPVLSNQGEAGQIASRDQWTLRRRRAAASASPASYSSKQSCVGMRQVPAPCSEHGLHAVRGARASP
jgi:hypothetical protein